ncbi:hypothetical protein [Campylobacter sp. MG1]|uniref:hypothetical protein n=1 Tax=Campylobacter sp. MG1 TaxID=2976332 RepID=UPI00226CEA21|nr:hypothetical protein [Campylobacter sp. MG1]
MLNEKYKKIAITWYKKAFELKLLTNKPIFKKDFINFLSFTIFNKISKDYEKQCLVISNKAFDYAKDTIKQKTSRSLKNKNISDIILSFENYNLIKTIQYAIVSDLITSKKEDTQKLINLINIFLKENNLDKKDNK